MAEQIKEVIKQEYVKCAQDPAYFMKKYCMIQHPIQGKIPFDLYDFQEKTINEFQEQRMNVILKARQLGISTLTAGYSLWMMTFQQDKNILVIATKQEVAKNLVTKVRVMHANLPSWLKQRCVEDNKLKHDKIIPGVDIPIYSKSKIKSKDSTILVLAWNFFDEIKKNNNTLSDNFINIKNLEK